MDRQMQASTASKGGIEAVGRVFQGLLEAALKDAAAGAFEDEEDNEGTGLIFHTTCCIFQMWCNLRHMPARVFALKLQSALKV